ncbi:MAG TPA: hypothetical protein DCG57_15305 [Candidatus Riflebacteria bacterium]|nr:hypothetical protein [Candidatus Riflebacteria bacterium]
MRISETDKQSFISQNGNLVIVLLLLIVLAVPVLLLRSKLDSMAQKEVGWQQIEAVMALHEELKSFKEDLKADLHLKRILQDIANQADLNRVFTDLNASTDTAQIDAGLNGIKDSLLAKLTSLGYPQPLFLVVAGRDVQSVKYAFSPENISARKSPEAAAEFICATVINAKGPALNDSMADTLDKLLKKCAGNGVATASYQDLQKQHFSSYTGYVPATGMVSRIFSDTYNFQSILFFSELYQQNSDIDGMLVIGFLEDSIKLPFLLKTALTSPRNLLSKRLIITPDKYYESLNIPGKRLTARVPLASFARRDKPAMPDGRDELYIGAELLRPRSSRTEAYSDLIRFASGLLTLFGLAALVNVGLLRRKLPFSLRQKIILILALALFVPGILVAIVVYGIAGHVDDSRADLAQSQLTASLDQIEMYYQETSSRQMLGNLRFKLAMTELLQRLSPDKVDTGIFSGYLTRHFTRSSIYDLDGQFLSISFGERVYQIDRLLQTNLVRFLNNTAGLRSNPLTRKHVDELAFTDGFVNNLTQADFFLNHISNESENIPSMVNVNPFSRDHYYLFPDLSSPELKPKAVGFFRINPDEEFEKYVANLPGYPHQFFLRNGDGYQTSLALARSSAEHVTGEFLLDLSSRKPRSLQALMHRAKLSGSSGNALGEDAGTITAWRFSDTRPLIFVGSVELQSDTFAAFYLQTFPYAMLVFTLLVLLVFSEVLSRFFLSPLETVLQGMHAIADEGELKFRVEINNNDEFDKVGEAFNAMVAGLLQKRHIARFVSSSLLKNVDNKGISYNSGSSFMSILASDLREFTSLSEQHPPEEIVTLLNDYFTAMEAEIQSEGGIIYRFIGDAIIAVFSGPDEAETALRACRTAIKMRFKLIEFNQAQKALGKLCVDNGIGVASGQVESSGIGQDGSRRDFIFFGAPVDLAEQLEGASKAGIYTKIVIDTVTARLVNKAFLLHPMPVAASGEAFEIAAEKEIT